MRKAVILTAAVLAAVIVFLLATIPGRPEAASGSIDAALQARTIPGAYHVHTTRSDGSADRPGVARAAARAGLRFVIFTDHGDGTRPLEAPAYLDGVLCIDGVEISTTGGHYAALGMRPSSYPLGGEPSAVVEDVRRLGGFGIVAHPDSARGELAWRDWSLAIDGLEWLSADTEWRNESRARLTRVLFDYLFRPGPALASILDRPTGTLARWDALASRRPVVGIAGHDAHGGISRRAEEEQRIGVPAIPSYEASFRTFAVRAIVPTTLSGAAESDARLLLDAIRGGHVFTAIDAAAGPAYLDFNAGTGPSRVGMGEEIGDPTAPLSVRASVPEGATILLLRDGRETARSVSGELHSRASGPGAYRVEIRTRRAPGVPPVPWIVGNPIYVALPPAPLASEKAMARKVISLDTCAWHIEKDPGSRATLSSTEGEVRMTYALRAGGIASQFAALACDLPHGLPMFDAIGFRVRSADPGRVSVQLRFARDGDQRWLQSVYTEGRPRDVVIAADDLVPAERAYSQRPDTNRATTILFVVDLTNAAPVSSGEFTISHATLGAFR